MSDGPVLDQINLVVTDMEASVEFYRRLGLDIPDAGEAFRAHHRSAQMHGGIALEFDSVESARLWDKGWRSGAAVLDFSLASRDQVDAVYADLTAAGHTGQQEPYDAFWGARYAVVEDPAGNAVGLMSPVDPSRRTPPGPPLSPEH
ncbi:MAG TPA: VOC family protein [Acidimicrobiales bacterium]|nr:VOC family protein [Acidimicrobiales bacterium]